MVSGSSAYIKRNKLLLLSRVGLQEATETFETEVAFVFS